MWTYKLYVCVHCKYTYMCSTHCVHIYIYIILSFCNDFNIISDI